VLDSPSDGKGKKKKRKYQCFIVSSPLSPSHPPQPPHRFPHSMPERKEGENKRIMKKKKAEVGSA